jgi:hypothetical protein
MKIGEWDVLGRSRALLQRQLAELAAHVTPGEEGRLRVLVATDIGLFDYQWTPADSRGNGRLHGMTYRWRNVQGLRLQSEATFDVDSGEPRSVWRLVAQEPKIELAAESPPGVALEPAARALLDFARAVMSRD